MCSVMGKNDHLKALRSFFSNRPNVPFSELCEARTESSELGAKGLSNTDRICNENGVGSK